MKKNAIFISQDLFLSKSKNDGGVSLCTSDFIDVISTKFNLITFPIKPRVSFFKRILNKIGVVGYHPIFLSKKDLNKIERYISEKEINYVFINHTYISTIAISIKLAFPHIKIVMCSHGNESGDFLHLFTRFSENMSLASRFFGRRKLGKLLTEEVEFRRFYFDAVLTVSEVEESIEKWLGAKNVIFIPRVFKNRFLYWSPTNRRIGFVSDISHDPNYFSILKFCELVINSSLRETIQLRLVGKNHPRYDYLKNQFSFVQCTGYLSEQEIVSELGTWNYYLNLVDYFSKGVSTKLAFGMNFGIPVISTKIGVRGYFFPDNSGPLIFNNIEEIVDYLSTNIENQDKMDLCKNNVMTAVLKFSDLNLVGSMINEI
jgi:glycosyltransferase involved in cell wall biosynthesis